MREFYLIVSNARHVYYMFDTFRQYMYNKMRKNVGTLHRIFALVKVLIFSKIAVRKIYAL